jgi:hypothetical protein
MIDYTGDTLIVNATTPKELHEALDTLHTQVIDNFPEAEQHPWLRVLEQAMEELEALGVEP